MKSNLLVHTLQENFSDEVFEELYFEVLGLMSYNASKITVMGNGIEDNIGILSMELVKAIDSFDVSKGIKFETYFNTVCRNKLLNEQAKNKKEYHVIKNADFDDLLKNHVEEANMGDIELKIDLANSKLTNEEKLIINSVLFENTRKVDLAKELGISKGRISQKTKEIYTKLALEFAF